MTTVRKGGRYEGTVHGTLPARLEEIRYYRTRDYPGYYKHPFEQKASIHAMEDGNLLITPIGGNPMSLWLDNPRRHHKHNDPGHRRHRHNRRRHSYNRRHRHNPYLAAFNPRRGGLMGGTIGHYVSVPYWTAVASGGAGFGITYLGYKVLFGFTALQSYGADPGYAGVAVRALGRIVVAALGDMFLARFFAGHNRMAYLGGASAYVGLSTGLELLGYDVTIGAPGGVPLQSILPAALQPATAIAGAMDGTGAFVRNARGAALPNSRFMALRGTGAFLQRNRLSGLGLTPQRLYHNALSPA